MQWLVYLSEARVGPKSADAAQIYLTARKRNRELGLTGYLHRENGCFLHYVEGPAEGLETLLVSLRRDWRHQNMQIFGRGPLKSRRFPDWDMAFTETPDASFAMWLGVSAGDGPCAQALAEASSETVLAFFDSLRDAG
ncbi:BLUF domain-containing protein [Aliiruegeria lutimaris]|uniref:Sensors of blue-light using FAD n=1 Tax=Aliiruegeria lutimaris TaxID=571298 RepID=A0A1G8J2Z4_9RHOB|nr:BLUF domain-containing protein [Aliiruegeria lutimaris]SDI25619.1 Sensors of blue-light using FAD [Aliiruegeria lutimaris]